MNEEKARERIDELRDFYMHLATYVAVNLFLVILNLVTSPDSIWFIYPLLGWGIGLAIHTAEVFWTGSDWEERKIQELTGLSQTQDEIQRLSERTENLITILSSVNWEKIDPELLQTRENLEETRQKIVQLQDQRDPESQAEVTEQLEKLEAFVTSSKFDFYELAASDNKGNS